MLDWVVVSNIFYFHPYLGKWSNLTNIFQMAWNHQLVDFRGVSLIIIPFIGSANLTTQPTKETLTDETDSLLLFW